MNWAAAFFFMAVMFLIAAIVLFNRHDMRGWIMYAFGFFCVGLMVGSL